METAVAPEVYHGVTPPLLADQQLIRQTAVGSVTLQPSPAGCVARKLSPQCSGAFATREGDGASDPNRACRRLVQMASRWGGAWPFRSWSLRRRQRRWGSGRMPLESSAGSPQATALQRCGRRTPLQQRRGRPPFRRHPRKASPAPTAAQSSISCPRPVQAPASSRLSPSPCRAARRYRFLGWKPRAMSPGSVFLSCGG